jgi:hypothetical protein
MQVCDEGGIGVRAGVDGVIVIVILGKRDPLGGGEVQFQVMRNGLLLLSSEGSGVLTRPCLISWSLKR